MTVRSFLELSTTHLTKNEAETLETKPNGSTVICAGEYGYFVYVPSEEDMDEFVPSFHENGLSDNFVNLMKYARSKSCDYILFDADAPIDSNLPIYDW